MFTYFTDRDGKYQLASLRESAFDPLSRTCDFMLKEEAYHMFVGATGIGRVVQRSVELMKEHDTADIGPFGGIDVAMLQRYLNFHYSVSLDLFGAETSTNAANYFAAGLKGRFQEEKRADDHRLKSDVRLVPECTDDGIGVREVILGAILLPFLPAGEATAVVATSRVVQTFGDALWALFAGIALRGPMRRAEEQLRVDQPAATDAADPAQQPAADPGRVPATGATRAGPSGVGRD